LSLLRHHHPLALAATLLLAGPGIAAPAPSTEAEELFVHRVLPTFTAKCLACHGDKPDKLKGDFDMRKLAGLLKGGASEEPSIVPGKPEESAIVLAITREDRFWEPMPPKDNDKLSDIQIDEIKEWIAGGAPWPDEERAGWIRNVAAEKWARKAGITVPTSGGLADDWTNRRYKPKNLWAYQPLQKPEPPAVGHPVDAFINQQLTQLDLEPAPLADRLTLIRRVTYDLTGLPPTPDEVQNFLTDSLPDDKAFASVVERLLASLHYGEKWGQHWLDVVRYADSSGFANDFVRGNAWRYRDYVIRSFNQDKPYNRFIEEQIAGDEIDPQNSELLVATGFLRMGPWELTSMEVAKVARQRFLDDATDMVGQTFLGHMLQCARCHDHKFDPIPTRDFYSMQAVLATTQLAERKAPFLDCEPRHGFEEEKKMLQQRRATHNETTRRINTKRTLAAARQWLKEKQRDPAEFEKAVAALAKKSKGGEKNVKLDAVRKLMQQRKVHPDLIPDNNAGYAPEDYGIAKVASKGLQRLVWDFDRYEPVAFAVYNGRTPIRNAVTKPYRMPADRMNNGELEETAILTTGNPFAPTDKVKPGVLSVVNLLNPGLSAEIPTTIEGRRRALAKWITDPRNPLTPRVMVNRIWQWHFGTAIAGNPNNFGATGKKPTHPELLDWLAATFIEKNWSVKEMHRLILTSDAYRRSANHPSPEDLADKDPLGESFAVFQARRLTAEELRDSMLAISGELNPRAGGIPVRPEMNLEAALQPRQIMGGFAEAWQPNPHPEDRHRRSIYAQRIRGQLDPMMEVFNSPSPDLSCEARGSSTVTPQVFSLFNGQATYDRAVALASRLRKQSDSREETISRLFQLVTGRTPSAGESSACLDHWTAMSKRHESAQIESPTPSTKVVREAVEEKTGERFSFTEHLEAYEQFVPDLKINDIDIETRGLAELCLVLLNSNEFAYVY